MMGRHRRLLTPWNASDVLARDLGMPDHPGRHAVIHEHDFKIVAEFTGRRESIAQCACGETRASYAIESAGTWPA